MLSIELGLLSAWVAFVCFNEYYKSKSGIIENQDEKLKSSRELRWQQQKELDKIVLERKVSWKDHIRF